MRFAISSLNKYKKLLTDAIAELRAKLRALNEKRLASPTKFWHSALYISFWLTLAFFPIGYGWREAMPPLCLVFLILYYRHNWENSVLRRLDVWWLFLFAAGMVIIGVAFSTNPFDSLLHAGTGLNKAYILPFIAMECASDEKDLRGLVWAMVAACFWEGLDGLWQAYNGHDFIMGYAPNNGRLTGSLGDYTVGNYLALTMIPAFGVWAILRQPFAAPIAALLFTALMWPAFFLFQGASSRSGLLAVAGAIFLWYLIKYGRGVWRKLAWPALVVFCFMLCQPGRLAPERIAGDNRWDLWSLGWRVFLEHPFFGAGSGQYNAAFRAMGLAPVNEVITISHPHNLYLDMLYAHGIVGFSLGFIFLAGFVWWGFCRISPALRAEARTGGIYWQLTAWFALGYAGWLINGIFGHDFYRTWWLALAMSLMGVMIGAVVNGAQHKKQ